MRLQWTASGLSDLTRLHDFLATVNPRAAPQIVRDLTAAAGRLPEMPRLGEALEQFHPREVRRILVGRYEMRYELDGAVISILRIWHTREKR